MSRLEEKLKLKKKNSECRCTIVSYHAVIFFLTADDAYSVNRTLRARGTVESWLYNVELAMYETVKM